ncbi:hypothetical protein Br6_05255 [Rhodococcus sp. Br-6]|nr:hypothetical protein Br6_05255 [Rhodococcus sp. Br-6]
MSTTLSMISRQLVSMVICFHTQSVHSSPGAVISGMVTSAGGWLPSGSCQTNSSPSFSIVVHARVLASGGTRRA